MTLLLLSIQALCYSQVEMLDCDEGKVSIKTGEYLFTCATGGGNTTVSLRRSDGSGGYLPDSIATDFISGKNFSFLKNGNVKKVDHNEKPAAIEVVLSGINDWTSFKIYIEFNKDHPGLIHYRVDLKTNKSMFITDTKPEWKFVSGINGDTSVNLQDIFATYPYLAQTSVYAPFAYYYDPVITKSRIFYYSNYTSMNEYYKYLSLEPIDAVSKFSNTSFGYKPPISECFQIPANAQLTVTDSYIYLIPELGSDIEYCRSFVECYAAIYDLIEKPDTEFADFRQVANNTLESLKDPKCISNYYPQQLLRAYVNIEQAHTDLCTYLMVLTSFQQFNKTFGIGGDFNSGLEKAVDMFYVPELKTIFDVPNPKKPQDITTHPESTWYYTFNMLQLGKIAQYDDKHRIREIFLETIPYMMRFSRSVDYEFPIFADYMTLKIEDPRLQGDMPGCYAYTMLTAYELTGNNEYLEEAKRSVEHFVGKGFKIGYEMHITASGIAACGWLYKITGDQHYLDISYIPLANLLRDTWLWESDLGYAYGYRTFNNIAAQRGCPVVGPVEQNEAWGFLREYYMKADKGLPASLKRLVPEYMKQMMASAYYSYPQTLPAEAVHPGPPYAVTDENLWIGLEGIYPGALKSGSIGQAVYMSGGAFRYAGYSYHQPIVKGNSEIMKGVFVYCEYPLVKCQWDKDAMMLDIETSGDAVYNCRMRIYFDPAILDLSGFSLQASGKTCPTSIDKDSFMSYIEYNALGGTAYSLAASDKTAKALNAETPGVAKIAKSIKTTYLPQSKAYISPGKTHNYTLIFDNPNDAAVPVKITAKLPDKWSAVYEQNTMLKHGINKLNLSVKAAAEIEPNGNIVEIIANIDGTRKPIVSQVFTVLTATVAPGDDLSDISQWQSVGTSLISREVTVDLDKAPVLLADMTGLDGGYTLFVSDEYTDPIRVISDTTHKGDYKCNLKKMTDWQGIHKFKFLLYSFGTDKKPVLKKFELGAE